MTNETSPYDEMIEKVDYLIKAYDRLNQKIEDNAETIEILKEDLIKQRKINLELHEEQKEINDALIKLFNENLKPIEDNMKEILGKIQPENPGDINTLYQNWDKK